MTETCDAREPEPRTGTSPCVLPAGHGGDKHQDKWTNQWPAVKPQEACGAWGGCPLPSGHNVGRADIPENHHGLSEDLFTGPQWETHDPEAEEHEREIQREA